MINNIVRFKNIIYNINTATTYYEKINKNVLIIIIFVKNIVCNIVILSLY